MSNPTTALADLCSPFCNLYAFSMVILLSAHMFDLYYFSTSWLIMNVSLAFSHTAAVSEEMSWKLLSGFESCSQNFEDDVSNFPADFAFLCLSL